MVPLTSAIARSGLVFSLVVTASTAAQANSVKLIFAAENALYGAGYDVGKADGWVDSELRSAIQQYQSRRQGLEASGQLDPDTLAALGVSSDATRTISGNDVFRQEDAVAELGLGKKKTAVRTQVVKKPKPSPKPENRIAKVTAKAPEPAFSGEAKVLEPKKIEASRVKPAPVQAVTKALEKPEVKPEITPQVKPEETSVSHSINEKIKPNEVKGQEVSEAIEAPKVAQAENASSGLQSIPTEPTGAGVPESRETLALSASASDAQTSKTSSQRGFFSSLFDFLFGWLV